MYGDDTATILRTLLPPPTFDAQLTVLLLTMKR